MSKAIAPPSPAATATGITNAAATAVPSAVAGVTSTSSAAPAASSSSSSPPMRRPITIHTGSLVQLSSKPHETLTPFQSVSAAAAQRIPRTPQSSHAAMHTLHSASHPTTPNYSERAGDRQHSLDHGAGDRPENGVGDRQHSLDSVARERQPSSEEIRPPLTAGRSDSRARNSFTHVSAAPTNTNSPSTVGGGPDTRSRPSSQVPTTNRVPSLDALTVPPAVRPGGGFYRGRSDSNGNSSSVQTKDSPPVSSAVAPSRNAASSQGESDRRARLRQAMIQQEQQFPGVTHISMAGFSDMSFDTERANSFDANGVTRSPNNQHASIGFDVRTGGATRAEGTRMQMQMNLHDEHDLLPPVPLTRQLSTVSVGGAKDEERAALHPYTLFFVNELAETEFRRSVLVVGGLSRVGLASPTSGGGDWKSNSTSFPFVLCAVAMMLFAAIGPYADQSGLDSQSRSVMRKKLILASAGGAVFILVALLNATKHRYAKWLSSTESASRRAAALRMHSQSAGMSASANSAHDAQNSPPRTGRDVLLALLSPQVTLCILFCAAGCLWAALNIDNDALPTRNWSTTVAAPVVLLLLLGSLMLDIFLFAHLLVCSSIICIVFCVIALKYKNAGEDLMYCVARCVIVLATHMVLCAHAYITELSVRLSHLRQQHLTHSKKELQKETAELRSEVFSLVLEKYDIIDQSATAADDSKLPAGSAVDLATPLEKSMKLLQELERDRGLSKKHFDKIRMIIEQLGSSQDNIFRPRLSQIVGSQQHPNGSNQPQHFRNQRQNRAAAASFSGMNGGYSEQKRIESSALQPYSSSPPLPHSVSGSQYQPGRAVATQLDADTTKWLAGLIDDFEEEESPNSPARAGQDEAPERSSRVGTATPTVTSMPAPLVLTNALSSEEEQTIHLLTDQLTNWDFDVFEVCKLTGNRPLFFLGLVLFRKNDLLRTFSLPKGPLCNFLTALEAGYLNDLPYHNSTHAADVTRSMHFFLHRGGLKSDLSDLEVLAALLAALSHDHAHPGVNNNFLVKTADPLAMLYNDKSE